jgi:RimJ/RimL family protein N-acetyltransferase
VRSSSPETETRIDAGRYFLRTLTETDASPRWGEWLNDAHVRHNLNVPARPMTQAEAAAYVRSFDQRARLLLGVFDRERDMQVGLLTLRIDRAASNVLANLLIGEPDSRNRGVLTTIHDPVAAYVFETVGVRTLVASVLARNTIVLNFLGKNGWVLDHALTEQVRSHSDGGMLDLCLLSLSRDDWRARQGAKAG